MEELTKDHIKQIQAKGLTLNTVNQQIATFKAGIPYSTIVDAATIDNGILKPDDTTIDKYIAHFNHEKTALKLLKFVPASGAATRMFKFLYKFLREYNPEEQSLNAYINKNNLKDLSLFLVGLEKFPFYNQVVTQLQSGGITYSELNDNEKVLHFVDVMLNETHLNFGNSPKGLLPFHDYKNDRIVTAFEEHLYEAALYASVNDNAELHFTISERFKDRFINEFNRIETYVEEQTGIHFNITYSYQKESTDTIAVTTNNTPYKNSDGNLVFRPSGHGALIKNLNALEADIVFIKNIDNVVVQQFREDVAKYKQLLAGILLDLQEQVFGFLNILENNVVTEKVLNSIAEFLTRQLNVKISSEFEKYSEKYKIEYLFEKLNRPIRICGMVKNEGEPGGGPFWVRDHNHKQSLQIVESAQINLKDKTQKQQFKNATHFNPVDLVCGIKDYKGNPFNLEDFVDETAGFISSKTVEGNAIKALELPGLWNGSMAFWNTVFVEVPIITFNPVKTVNDLLKVAHQIK